MRRPTLDILAEAQADDGASRAPALRTQLLAGLALILVVVATSSGIFSFWSTRRQLAATQLVQARALGHGVAALFAANIGRGKDDPRWPSEIRRLLSALSSGPAWGRVEVYGRDGSLLGATGRSSCSASLGGYVRRALRTQQQLMRPAGSSGGVEVVTPVYGSAAMRPLAAIRLCLPLKGGEARPLLSTWILMAIDSLVLLLFVAIVVTRYVTRPLQRMRQAAAQVARGNLDVQLNETGSAELSSLATSFNRMTLALQIQLRQLEEQQQSLVQSEKLASVGRLAAGIAHEVGNPLQSIIGFTDILLDQKSDDADRRDFLQRIQSESQRIHGILRELLDYSRPGDERPEPLDLSTVVGDALSLVQHTPRFREVEVEARVGGGSVVLAVPGRLVQVLVNLLLNAADAMQGTGRVTIVALRQPETIQLRVANSGPPIAPEAREQIFDPFFTTKAPGEGTGLGLAVAYSIVESFGGQLTLDPSSEQTTFVVSLPRASPLETKSLT